MSTSNLKQARLDFNVTKRTGSNTKPGKASQTSPKPVDVVISKLNKPTVKTEAVDTDNSHEDFIVVSSDDEDSEGALTDASNTSAVEKDVPIPAVRRSTRAAVKDSPKKISKPQDGPSIAIKNVEESQTFELTTKADPATVKTVGATATEPTGPQVLPELKIKDTKWTKHYIEVKAKMGGLPAIHGETQNRIHEILRVFDDSYEYGPCVGVSRLERWNRANALGLNPPKEVEQILYTKQGASMPEYSQSVFYGEV